MRIVHFLLRAVILYGEQQRTICVEPQKKKNDLFRHSLKVLYSHSDLIVLIGYQ